MPLPAFATVQYELEQPIVWRRDRLPTITVQAGVVGDAQPATVVDALKPAVDEFIAALPANYRSPSAARSRKAPRARARSPTVVPLMLFLMATVLMMQLQSFQKLLLVVSVAPLGLIGVVAALLVSGKPLGFVAILGVLALIGIIIRNAVILVSQIDDFRAEGRRPWDAVIEATHHRMRPILLTAAAASLGMIPIAREVFWGPMAYAMIGGILVAHAADAAVPAGALRRLVPYQGAGVVHPHRRSRGARRAIQLSTASARRHVVDGLQRLLRYGLPVWH